MPSVLPPGRRRRRPPVNGRVSRRRFLTGTVAVAGALAVAACTESPSGGGGTPQPESTPSSAARRGGILRAYTFGALTPETFDPHQSRGGPIADVHSAVFSRLYRYSDDVAGTIVPDLAKAMPEQPDELTYIIPLREGVTFHDTPGVRTAFPTVAGRPLDSEDVRQSIERQLNLNSPRSSRFLRAGQLSVIERVVTPNRRTVTIRLKRPVAPFLAMLAAPQAHVIARETVDTSIDEMATASTLVGSGPFTVDSFEPGVVVRLRRNTAWFAANDGAVASGPQPWLDGIDAYFSPQESAFQRAAFERQAVDVTELSDVEQFERVRATTLADVSIDEAESGCVLASRLLVDRAPFKDDRIRRAVHLAIDRRALAAVLYPPFDGRDSARLSGPIPPALSRWAISGDKLVKTAAYREDRAAAIAEAKQLMSAALGDGVIAAVPAIFAGVPKAIAGPAAEAVRRQLAETIGMRLVPVIDPTGDVLLGGALRRNVEGAAEGAVLFTFGLEGAGADLDDHVYQFRSGQTANTYRNEDATLDDMIDRQRSEFDEDARRQIGHDIQQYLLGKANVRIEYLAPVQRRLRWGYARDVHQALCFGGSERLAGAWLDTGHPAWSTRPA